MRGSTILLALGLALLGLSPAAGQEAGTITIGSKTFAESRLLAEIMAQKIEAETELTVERKLGLGGTKFCTEALRTGDIDLYPEYTGTILVEILKIEGVKDPLRTYIESRDRLVGQDLVVFPPFGFNNTYVFAMPEARAEELGVDALSDLFDVKDQVRAGFSNEFLERSDGYAGLRAAHGLELNVRGMEHALAYQAIEKGQIDLVDAYSTDGELVRYKLRALKDDLTFFPPYQAVPLARRQLLEEHPEVRAALLELSFSLTDRGMQKLNYLVGEEKRPVAEVAADYLSGALDDYLAEDLRVDAVKEEQRTDMQRFFSVLTSLDMLRWTGQHLLLTVLAVLLASLLSVPLGIAITRNEVVAGPVLSAVGVIQTIPSLALLAIFIPFLGLGAKPAVAALFLYALLPIVRNTYTGIKEVDAALIEAARGMGLTDGQILWRVEIPLAVRTIMAGVRTSTVISVGVATLAAFIGAGGLGEPIISGIQLNDGVKIWAGALPAAALAIAVDLVLGQAERGLAPRGVA